MIPHSAAPTTIATFTNTSGGAKGSAPYSELLNDGLGYMWGTTSEGGAAGFGTIFKINITDLTFTTVIDSSADAPPGDVQITSFGLSADLGEDQRYCWRVRSDDGQVTSGYNVACFLVSLRNDPPTVPVLTSPASDAIVTTVGPFFTWVP